MLWNRRKIIMKYAVNVYETHFNAVNTLWGFHFGKRSEFFNWHHSYFVK